MNIAYIDFDGTLIDSPLPEIGKQLWSDWYGKPYPYEGWWGRIESLDSNVFNIRAIEDMKSKYIELKNSGYKCYILTSRLPKFTNRIQEILLNNDIEMDGILTHDGRDKGVRILEHVKSFNDVKIVEFYDDRDKEIHAVSLIIDDLKMLGVSINIYQV